MQDIRLVYPGIKENDKDWFYAPGDYTPLLESFGYEIVVREDDQEYQGDSFILYFDRSGDHGEYDGMDQYGILIFGWGSCSGCDALQGCQSYQEIDDLRKSLHDSIIWDSARSQLRYFETHDWDGDYHRSSDACKKWINESIAYLEKIISSD